MEIAAACAREIVSRCRPRRGAVGYVGAGVGGYSVFGEAATRSILSMCEICPCIRTASYTTKQPDSESEFTVTTGVSKAEGDKKKRLVSANFIVFDAAERTRQRSY